MTVSRSASRHHAHRNQIPASESASRAWIIFRRLARHMARWVDPREAFVSGDGGAHPARLRTLKLVCRLASEGAAKRIQSSTIPRACRPMRPARSLQMCATSLFPMTCIEQNVSPSGKLCRLLDSAIRACRGRDATGPSRHLNCRQEAGRWPGCERGVCEGGRAGRSDPCGSL